MRSTLSPATGRGRPAVELLESRDTPAAFAAFGAAAGGQPLIELNRPDGTAHARFAAFDAGFFGGVRAAVGELDGDPTTVELVAGAGPGGGPHVRVFSVPVNGGQVSELASFFAFEPGFRGGVRLAVGNVGGPDERQEIVVAADAGGGPRVRTFTLSGNSAVPIGGPLGDFFAFEPGFLGGVRVAAGELDDNPADGDELVLAAGAGGGPRVRILRSDGATLADYQAFRPDYAGGANVFVDQTGGVGRLLVDGQQADMSQRGTGLNSLAGIGGTSGSTGGGQTTGGSTQSAAVTGTTGGTTGSTNNSGFGTGTGVGGTGTTTVLPGGVPTAGFGTGVGGFGPFSTFGPGVTDPFGTFGSPGVVTPLPTFSTSPFAGTFTGVRAGGTGLSGVGLGTSTGGTSGIGAGGGGSSLATTAGGTIV